MTQSSWLRSCGALAKNNTQTPEKFRRCCLGKVSPLYWRVPILAWAVAILSWSTAAFWGPLYKYLLYMTHWGLMLIIVESIFGIVITVKKPQVGFPNDATFGLPWYVKIYWLLYNVTIPVAFLVTVFYWGILSSSKGHYFKPDPVLDVMLHGANSVVMTVELVCSAHPSRLLHIFQPLFFGLAYVLFTVVYYAAGGVDPWGHEFIYPVIDWSKPQQTMVVVTLTALFLALMHLVAVAAAAARDAAAHRLRSSPGIYNDGFGEES